MLSRETINCKLTVHTRISGKTLIKRYANKLNYSTNCCEIFLLKHVRFNLFINVYSFRERINPHKIGPREEKGDKESMKIRGGGHTVLFFLFFSLVDSLKITYFVNFLKIS
jgi:hypothetical protein